MNRRNFLEGLTAGTVVAGIPPVQEVRMLKVTEHDAVVLRFKERLSHDAIVRIKISWNDMFPGIKAIVLDGDADISVLKDAGGAQIGMEQKERDRHDA